VFALKAAIVVLVLFVAGVLRDRRSFGNAVLLGLALALLALGTAERLARAHDAVSKLVLLAVFALVALAPLLVAVYLVANGVTMLRRESVRPANLLSLLVGVGILAVIGFRLATPLTSSDELGLSATIVMLLFGYVSFTEHGGGPTDFEASADFTAELAEENPDWKLDLSDEVIGAWRGEEGKRADLTLVWGVPLVPGGAIVTAELANLAVDQCELVDERFTLIAPDAYRGDYLEVKLWGRRGEELAVESLYVEDDDADEDPAEDGSEG